MPSSYNFTKLLKSIHERWIVLFCLVIILLHHSIANLGFYGMDDINYARYAASFTKNQFHPFISQDHFAHRWLPIFITGVFYWLLGINDFSSALFGIITTVGTCWIILRITRKSGKQIQLIAVFLYLLSYSTIFASHRIWPDTGIAFFLMYGLYTYLNNRYHPACKGALLALSLFAALLCKETILVFVPLTVFLLINDLAKKKNKTYWLAAGLSGAILLFMYFTAYWYHTGNAFFRYTTLHSNNYENICSFEKLPIEYTLKRIGYELWMAFIRNGDALLYIPAILAIFYQKKINQGAFHFPVPLYFLILLLSSNFISLSITSYIPICHDPRHFLFLMPLAAISAAPLLINYFKTPSAFSILPITYLLASVLLFFSGGGETKFIYAIATLLLVAALWMNKTGLNKRAANLLLIFFTGIFLIRPGFDLFKVTYPQYSELKAIVKNIKITNNSKPTIVFYTDTFTQEMTAYFLEFQESPIKSSFLEPGRKFDLSNNNNLLLLTKSDTTKTQEYYIQNFFGPNVHSFPVHETNYFLLVSINSIRQVY